MSEEPIHRAIQIVLVGVADGELLRERRGMPPARGGELGVWRQHARGHHRTHQIALRRGTRGDQLRKAQAVHGESNGLHVPVRARGNRLEEFCGRGERFAAQNRANGKDLLLGERRQISQRPFAYARALAEGFAQQIGGARAAVGHDVNMHGCILRQYEAGVNWFTWLHTARLKCPSIELYRLFYRGSLAQ